MPVDIRDYYNTTMCAKCPISSGCSWGCIRGDDLAEIAELREGWKEAAIAWAVCASIHREYAKGKDPFYKTRQGDFTKHEEAAHEKLRCRDAVAR
jgi:hypothetical protein